MLHVNVYSRNTVSLRCLFVPRMQGTGKVGADVPNGATGTALSRFGVRDCKVEPEDSQTGVVDDHLKRVLLWLRHKRV